VSDNVPHRLEMEQTLVI